MSDTPKLWREMTPEEKGALLLAHHERSIMQVFRDGEWFPFPNLSSQRFETDRAYRVKPEPKRETVMLLGGPEYNWMFERTEGSYDHYRITFDLIDGEPDCASIRMERIK